MTAIANRPVSTQSPQAEKLRQAASDLALRGWPVFPVTGGTGDLSLATTDRLQISKAWSAKPTANVGLATGAQAGFFTLRVIGQAGKEYLADLEAKHGALPRTTTLVEPDGTRELLFRWPAGRSIPTTPKLPEIPLGVAGEDGYVLAPPSVDALGGKITWETSPNHKSPAIPPVWLLDLVADKPAAPVVTVSPGSPSVDREEAIQPDTAKPIEPASEVEGVLDPPVNPVQPMEADKVYKKVENFEPAVKPDINDKPTAKQVVVEGSAEETTARLDKPAGKGDMVAKPAVLEPPPLPPEEAPVEYLPVGDLKLHLVADRVPRMRDDEWQAVRADILERGVLDPILVQRPNIVIDGRHRLEAAKERGDQLIPARVVDLRPEEQVRRVYAAAILRRHFSDDQRAMMAAEMAAALTPLAKQERARKGGQAGGRSRKKTDSSAPHGGAKQSEPQSPQSRRLRTRDRVAATFRVSPKKVAKAVALKKASPELADEVLAGKVSLAKAKKNTSKKTHGNKQATAGDCTLKWLPDRVLLEFPQPVGTGLVPLAYALYHALGHATKDFHSAFSHVLKLKGDIPKHVLWERDNDATTHIRLVPGEGAETTTPGRRHGRSSTGKVTKASAS
jgi:ParB-like chromosome segregation protein Spo0J